MPRRVGVDPATPAPAPEQPAEPAEQEDAESDAEPELEPERGILTLAAHACGWLVTSPCVDK